MVKVFIWQKAQEMVKAAAIARNEAIQVDSFSVEDYRQEFAISVDEMLKQ